MRYLLCWRGVCDVARKVCGVTEAAAHLSSNGEGEANEVRAVRGHLSIRALSVGGESREAVCWTANLIKHTVCFLQWLGWPQHVDARGAKLHRRKAQRLIGEGTS
jgi:hypothetical protein